MLWRAEITQSRVWFGRDVLHERSGEPGFANPGLTGQQHDLAFAGLGSRPAPQEQFKFFFSSDQCSQSARVHRLEAALDRTCPQHRESCHRPGDPLELLWPEVPQLEEIAQQPAGGLGNDDRVRLGDALKACREVRRLADDTALLRFAGPDKVPDHHQAGGNPNPHLYGLRSRERSNRIDQREAGPNGTLGVILMRLRIAEINQHAVAHIFRDEAPEAAHSIGDARLIGRNDLAQVLRVHACGERRRTNKVHEHHGDLPALGAVLGGVVGCQRSVG